MFDQMKKLMEMKRQADQIKRKLENERIEISDSGIRIMIDGAQKFKSIEVDSSLISIDNKKNLEASILKSINQAISQSQVVAAGKMKELVGLDIPGL